MNGEGSAEKTVRELMLSLAEYATISAEATIKEALIALSKAQMGLTYDRHHHRAVLALDDQGRVVGKLTYWSMLRALEPRFFGAQDEETLVRAGLSPEFIDQVLGGSERVYKRRPALRALCAEAGRVKVKDAMAPVAESIDEDAPLTDAIRMLVLGHWQSVLVHREGQVVGILRLADVFEEVADLIRSS